MNYEDRITKSYLEDALAAKCEVLVGTYTGDGRTSRTFNLGVTPKAVIVRSIRTEGTDEIYQNDYYHTPMIAVTGTDYTVLHIVEGGFAVNKHTLVNKNTWHYLYIAFV